VAATRYRPDMGVKYSTYAWNTARGYIQHALRDYSRMVRTPRWIANYKNQVSALIQEGKTYKEIAEILDLDEVKVMHCELSTNNYHVSYDSSPEDWVTPQFVYNFEEHKEATKDVANAPLVALSIDELNNVYAKYFEWFKSNKSIVNQEYYDRYVAQYIF
jgi:DNA-directed RNA polymerase specialized sigma subunit